jgi:hypothetical protein
MYSSWDIFVRELGGGIWFFTSFWLVIAFSAYIVRETARDNRRDGALIAAATALVVYFIGSMIRGLLTWMQFFFAGNGWDPKDWIATWPWFGLSVLFNIVGAEACIYLLSSWRWRLCLSILAGITSILVPVVVRTWF